MGLDQFAYKHKPTKHKHEFIWRKHSQLQTWMEQLYTEKTGGSATEFNCKELELELADIQKLETAIKKGELPHCDGGFFYGHQWQDEATADYREHDLKFCAWAKKAIKAGYHVYYSCWW